MPAPDGPTSATSSPGLDSKSMSSSPNVGEARGRRRIAGRSQPRPEPPVDPHRCAPPRAASAIVPSREPSPRRARRRGVAPPRWRLRVGAISVRLALGGVARSASVARGLAPPGSGTTRPRKRDRAAHVAGSSATASGASTISGSMSRYSKIRSNSASEPWISTWTLSSWPSGKNSRLWRVVKATMSPAVGASGAPLAASVAGQPVHERRHDAEDRPDDHEEPAADHRLADLRGRRARGSGPGTARPTGPAGRTSWPAGCR